MSVSNKIGEKIRQLRVLGGLSQENVAEEIGMTHGNYGKIERGEIDISSTHLIKLAKVLKVSVNDFFENKLKVNSKESKAEYGYATKVELLEIGQALQHLTTIVEKLQDTHKVKNEKAKKKSVKTK